MILHSDANCFYASVEMVEHPEYRNKRIAVCGDTEQRHGIVLTANYPAKHMGVKTGMANWQALQVCPDLTIVHPHYELYLKYSKMLQKIYKQYSDRVESFGMDECWIDLPFSEEESIQTAQKIQQQVNEETGLTVSIGVSFSKALAKLGSDMKKPNGLTILLRSDFKEKCWHLPASDLLYVGPSTTKKLCQLGILTIGDLATAPESVIAQKLGKNGLMVQSFANGADCFPVAPKDYRPEPKSFGHGATCVHDLNDNYSVWLALYDLAQDVSHRLIAFERKTRSVNLYVRDNTLSCRSYHILLDYPTQSPLIIAQTAYELFCQNYNWDNPVRALTVAADRLQDEYIPEQLDIFDYYVQRDKRNRVDKAIDEIRNRFGINTIRPGCFVNADLCLATDKCETVTMPGMVFR